MNLIGVYSGIKTGRPKDYAALHLLKIKLGSMIFIEIINGLSACKRQFRIISIPNSTLHASKTHVLKIQAGPASFHQSKKGFCPTMSIGIALFDGRLVSTRQQLMEAADQALYKAKHSGRNCIRIF